MNLVLKMPLQGIQMSIEILAQEREKRMKRLLKKEYILKEKSRENAAFLSLFESRIS